MWVESDWHQIPYSLDDEGGAYKNDLIEAIPQRIKVVLLGYFTLPTERVFSSDEQRDPLAWRPLCLAKDSQRFSGWLCIHSFGKLTQPMDFILSARHCQTNKCPCQDCQNIWGVSSRCCFFWPNYVFPFFSHGSEDLCNQWGDSRFVIYTSLKENGLYKVKAPPWELEESNASLTHCFSLDKGLWPFEDSCNCL